LGLGFRVWSLGFEVKGEMLRYDGLGLMVSVSGSRSGPRPKGLEVGVWSLGFRFKSSNLV
jgi:hypothetical protein